MRVLIIGINYRPEVTAIGPYTAGLAEHLVARGDEVTVLTGLPHYPAWKIGRGTARRLCDSETIADVHVVRAAHYVPSQQSALRRALYEGTFGLTGLLAAPRLRGVDAVLGVVPSLSGGVLARAYAVRYGVPYGLLFQDLTGPAARQSGIPGGGTVARATSAAEAWVARRAETVGVVTDSFVPYLVEQGVDPLRVRTVPNWARLAQPSWTPKETRRRLGWTDGRQVVLHAGNMGLKQGLERVVEAAVLAAERCQPVRFVLAGGGNQAAAVRAAAVDVPNLDVLPVQPDPIHASLLAAADALLLSERASQIDMSLPSKLTSYFAAGRPIVAAVPIAGASAREVGRSGAGLVVPAGDPDALLDALSRLREDRALADGLAAAGPRYVDAELSARACLARAAQLVDAIAGSEAA